jgi:hypothetical protein
MNSKVLIGLTPTAAFSEGFTSTIHFYIVKHHSDTILAGCDDDGILDEAFDECYDTAESFDGLIADMRRYVTEHGTRIDGDEWSRNGLSKSMFYKGGM